MYLKILLLFHVDKFFDIFVDYAGEEIMARPPPTEEVLVEGPSEENQVDSTSDGSSSFLSFLQSCTYPSVPNENGNPSNYNSYPEFACELSLEDEIKVNEIIASLDFNNISQQYGNEHGHQHLGPNEEWSNL